MVRVLGESGPAVLLLPGGAEEVDGFFPGLIEGLMSDPGCRVILYDRPGTVGSEIDGTLAEATGAIHTVLADLGLGPVVAIGQSLGGAVALLLALDHPDDVAGLVLLDATPVNDPILAARIVRTTGNTVRLSNSRIGARMLAALLRSSAKRSARRHDMSPATRAATLKIADVDVERLGRAVVGMEEIAANFDESRLPRVPAVVVTADRKPGDSVRHAHERLATAFDVQLVSWPGAEHQVHLTHPDEVLEVCRQIVREVAEAGSPAPPS